MKKVKDRCGAVLLEILLSIAILGLLTVPISSGILMSLHINEKSDEIIQAKLAVSSAVETIMAEGIASVDAARALDLQDVIIESGITLEPNGYWKLTVRSKNFDDIFVEIRVRSNDVRTPEGGGT